MHVKQNMAQHGEKNLNFTPCAFIHEKKNKMFCWNCAPKLWSVNNVISDKVKHIYVYLMQAHANTCPPIVTRAAALQNAFEFSLPVSFSLSLLVFCSLILENVPLFCIQYENYSNRMDNIKYYLDDRMRRETSHSNWMVGIHKWFTWHSVLWIMSNFE